RTPRSRGSPASSDTPATRLATASDEIARSARRVVSPTRKPAPAPCRRARATWRPGSASGLACWPASTSGEGHLPAGQRIRALLKAGWRPRRVGRLEPPHVLVGEPDVKRGDGVG